MSQLLTPLLILALIVISVIAIVTDQRFEFEQKLRQKYGIDRDWWVPVIAFSTAVGFDIVSFSAVRFAFTDKIDIIALIFSFGIMAEGLGRSGFFTYLSYKVVDRCKGNSARLILYMFVMTSIVTLFTTNDIVVLVITPIIVEICYRAELENTKLILLSQFIAANTLSMGLLIGSPTNIIIAEEAGIDFFTYYALMILPALVAFGASLVLVDKTIQIAQSNRYALFGDMAFSSRHKLPDHNPEPYLTTQMRNWVVIFGGLVGSVAIVTLFDASLLWCAVPMIVIGLGYWYVSEEHEESLKGPILRLPYGVFFFGMTFFVFAEEFSRTGLVGTQIIPALEVFFEGDPITVSLVGTFGGGILVNVFNDLPASALIAGIISELQFETFLNEIILVQGVLVGVNIGTYVTQIGALAGLIWFNTLRNERKRLSETFPELDDRMVFPARMDLVRYGFLHFCFAGVVTGLFLLFKWVVVSFFIAPHGI